MTKFNPDIHTKQYFDLLEIDAGNKQNAAEYLGITPKTYGIWYKKAIVTPVIKPVKPRTPPGKKQKVNSNKHDLSDIIASVDGFINQLKKRPDHIYYDFFMNSIIRMKKKPDRAKYEKFIVVLRDLGYRIVKE